MTLFIVILISVAILALKLWMDKSKTNELVSEGKIIDRKGAFFEKGEDFTLASVDADLLSQKVKELPYADMAVSMNYDATSRAFAFSHASFKAKLWHKGTDSGKDIYCFQFTNWRRNRNGVIYGLFQMNMLLTAIEKMFLGIDPHTQVHTYELETKTRIF